MQNNNSNINDLPLEQEMLFKRDFCLTFLKESEYVVKRRRQDLLEWLKNFFDYTFIKGGHADKIIIHDIYAEYEKIPKKQYNIAKRLEKRKIKEDYLEDFIINALFEAPASEEHLTYSFIARNIPYDDVQEVFEGVTLQTIARYYAKPVLLRIAEQIPPKDWVWFTGYEKLTEEERNEWIKTIQEEENKSIDKMRFRMRDMYLFEDAWIEHKNIIKQDNFYKNAIHAFQDQYGDFPVQSFRWILKEEYRDKLSEDSIYRRHLHQN